MELRPVAKNSASGAVFDQLFALVVDGSIEPGEVLPAERTLTESLKVNRQAIREALQRLAQAGLVAINQGESTKVLDYRRTGGLALLPHLLADSSGDPDVGVVRSVMEMRAVIGPDAARLAAVRIAPEATADLIAITDAMSTEADLTALACFDLEFWDVIVDACDNIAYRLAYNSLRSIYEPLSAELSPVLEEELRAHRSHERLARAIETGDAETAANAARELLARGTNAINQLIAANEEA